MEKNIELNINVVRVGFEYGNHFAVSAFFILCQDHFRLFFELFGVRYHICLSPYCNYRVKKYIAPQKNGQLGKTRRKTECI